MHLDLHISYATKMLSSSKKFKPRALEDVQKNHYVDDFIVSVEDEGQATELATQIIIFMSLLASKCTTGRLALKKFWSNYTTGTQLKRR